MFETKKPKVHTATLMENELASVTLEQIVTDLLVRDSSISSTTTTINKG